jgi:hypothetical protein
MASGSTGGSVSTNPDERTLAYVRDGHIKYKNMKKDQLKLLCGTFLDHIEDLKLRLEKAKAPHNVSTPNETFELRAELNELKRALFVDENGINAMGDKPASLTQAYWATGNRRVIPWDDINRLAEDNPLCKTSNREDDVKGVVNAVNETSVEKGDVISTPSKAKLAKLAKLVKLAK